MIRSIAQFVLLSLWLAASTGFSQADFALPEGPPPDRPKIEKDLPIEAGLDVEGTSTPRTPEPAFRFPSVGTEEVKEKNVFHEAYGDDPSHSMPEAAITRRNIQFSEKPAVAVTRLGSEVSDPQQALPTPRKAVSWAVIFTVGSVIVISIAVLMVILSRPPKVSREPRAEEHL